MIYNVINIFDVRTVSSMLTNKDIYEIIESIDDLYNKYRLSYVTLKQEALKKGNNVKFSSGGNIYPFGKLFFAQSKIYRKCTKQSTGHFCLTIDNANFAYVYSFDGDLVAINQMFDYKNNKSGKVDYTTFVLSFIQNKYLLKYLEHYKMPVLHEIGIIRSHNNNNVIMIHSDVPCRFLKIVLIDEEKRQEHLYSISKEIFTMNYSTFMEHNVEYKNFATLQY